MFSCKSNQRAGKGILTNEGKRMHALIMYNKGKEFLAASILLHQRQENQTFVQIHLFLQGLEIVYKGMLLYYNYSMHSPRLRSKYRHNLVRLTNQVKKIDGYDFLDADYLTAISYVNKHYKTTNLRYGTLMDIFYDPTLIDIAIIKEKTKNLIETFEKQI